MKKLCNLGFITIGLPILVFTVPSIIILFFFGIELFEQLDNGSNNLVFKLYENFESIFVLIFGLFGYLLIEIGKFVGDIEVNKWSLEGKSVITFAFKEALMTILTFSISRILDEKILGFISVVLLFVNVILILLNKFEKTKTIEKEPKNEKYMEKLQNEIKNKSYSFYIFITVILSIILTYFYFSRRQEIKFLCENKNTCCTYKTEKTSSKEIKSKKDIVKCIIELNNKLIYKSDKKRTRKILDEVNHYLDTSSRKNLKK